MFYLITVGGVSNKLSVLETFRDNDLMREAIAHSHIEAMKIVFLLPCALGGVKLAALLQSTAKKLFDVADGYRALIAVGKPGGAKAIHGGMAYRAFLRDSEWLLVQPRLRGSGPWECPQSADPGPRCARFAPRRAQTLLDHVDGR